MTAKDLTIEVLDRATYYQREGALTVDQIIGAIEIAKLAIFEARQKPVDTEDSR